MYPIFFDFLFKKQKIAKNKCKVVNKNIIRGWRYEG